MQSHWHILIFSITTHGYSLEIMLSCDTCVTHRARTRLAKQKEEEAKPPSEKAARLQELHKNLRVSHKGAVCYIEKILVNL